MRTRASPRFRLAYAAAAAWLLALAGCAATAPPAPAPPAPAAAVVAPAPIPSPPPSASPAPRPAAPARAEIALVVDTSAPSHAAVAAAIAAELPARLYRVTELASDAPGALAGLRDRRVTVVAVGAEAVAAARAELPGKDLVFCQVLAHDEILQTGARAWGIDALPPLALQLASWRDVDPTLRTIALLVSDAGSALAAEARRAADELAADLLVETSSSDRETLYRFRRIASAVDGLWLLPDTQALSPNALRELLSYAAARGIRVLAFNEALLARGALLSATSVPADVAASVRRVVEQVVAGRTAELPAMTPLSAAALAINADVAAALGLPPRPATRWVARAPD